MSEQGSSQYDFDNAIRAYVDPHELHHYNFADDWGQHEAKIDNICEDETGKGLLAPALEHRIRRTIYKLFAQLDANIASGISSGNKVYTGTAGIAMLKLLNDERFHYKSPTLDKAYELFLKSADECPVNDRISFLNGNAGVVAVAAVAHHKAGNLKKSQDLLEKLVQFSTYCSLKNSSAPPDEVLYGRAGYLYSLLYVRKHLTNATIIVQDSIVKRVAQDIIDSGIQSAKAVNSTSPLYYKWHGKEYVGAAHGYSGIFQVLLMARKQKLVSYSTLKNYLVPALDYILPVQYPSRNYPTSMESRTGHDRLVQWCHGAPGMIYMGAEAYEILRDEYYGSKFRDVVFDLAEVTWYRGLLKKGYGLCHGVAGNGYALLRVYHLNKELKYLNRAARFAEWCLDYGANQTHVPDRPCSLFEGISGVIYFLIDILNFEEAKFPGVDL